MIRLVLLGKKKYINRKCLYYLKILLSNKNGRCSTSFKMNSWAADLGSLSFQPLTVVKDLTVFSNFSFMFLNPFFFSNLNPNCSNSLYLRNLQNQVRKAFSYQKLFWIFTVWIKCSTLQIYTAGIGTHVKSVKVTSIYLP